MALDRPYIRQRAQLARFLLGGRWTSKTLSEERVLKVQAAQRSGCVHGALACALLWLRDALRHRRCDLPRTQRRLYTVVCSLTRSSPAVTGLVCAMFLEAGYDKWLCDVLLFELHTSLSGVFVRGGRSEKQGRVPCGMTRIALCDSGSGAVGASVWSVVTS